MADVPVTQTVAPKLPRYLDVRITARPPEEADLTENEEWGIFGDNDGRMIAQRVELVFNASNEEDPHETKEDLTTTQYKQNDQVGPGVVLVVSTDCGEELPLPSSELPEEMFSNDLETSYHRTKTWVEKQEDIGESIFSHQHFEYELSTNKDSTAHGVITPYCSSEESVNDMKPLNSQDFDGFPCVRSEWYIRKPVEDGALVDDVTIVDTQILVDDVRNFLKQYSIPLQTYANHLNRTQGTLSDLLNHPKQWKQLSNKGREVYIKLMEFLSTEDLSLVTTQLQRKRFSVGGEKLPDNILEPLSRGTMPSDKNILLATSCSNLGTSQLKAHCENQIELYNLQEMAPGDLLVPHDDGQEVHLSNSPGRCICTYPGCGIIVQDESTSRIHMISHFQSKPQQCTVCKRNFATKVYLNSHLRVHTKTIEICSRAKDRLRAEMQKSSEINFESDHEETKLSDMKYVCGMCWKGFKSRQRLTKHLSLHHLVRQKNLYEGFTCYVCRKVSKNMSGLEVHMRTHTNNRPYECDQCEMGFQTKANLQRHIKTHTGEKPYACSVCPARFIEAKSLMTHVRVHTGEKPMECKVCGRRFAQPGALKAHMLIHEEKKPFSCDTCGWGFRQKTNLLVHMKRHLGIKNHKCSKCEMTFLTKSDFVRHLQKHNGTKLHKCEFCTKRFTRPVYLRDHLKRLVRPSAPQCHRCHKKFCNDSLLKKHLVTHELQQKNRSSDEFTKRDMETSNLPIAEAFATLNSSENNVLLLAANTAFNAEKHYILAPMQALGGHASLDQQGIGSFQPVVLQADDSRIPFSTTHGNSVFLQGIELSGSQVSDMLFTTVRGLNVPISLSDEEDTLKNAHEIMDGSDPNMQCTVAKNADDSMILTQDLPQKRIKHSDPEDPSCQVMISNPMTDANLPVVISMGDNSQVNVPACHSELMPESALMNTHPGLSTGSEVQATEDCTKGQTYIIVDLELK